MRAQVAGPHRRGSPRLDAAFPKELGTRSLPAFLLLAFWCHSVINKESEGPRNCFSPLPLKSKAELVANDDTC